MNTLHAAALATFAQEPRNAPEWQVRGIHEENAQHVAVRRQFAAHLLFGRPLGSAAQRWVQNRARVAAVQAAQESR
ncbi:hypothetical protein IHN63_01710 [Deinococcus sp. 6YEL10]|uniref:hypothetical protein n=1 Tax=Deinococcus sp. 6YEL10 TaxID=2745870 RepID=UPI001E2D7BD4|nr:hypothetical protein [Deinococcus sp. 6YEL10]MCD0160015.1 hypothetical protein [Deinococcus sp. 6YEL10]